MPWIGTFRRNISEAYNGVDGYFSVNSLQLGGISTPYERIIVTPTKITLISSNFLGMISFIGTGLSVTNVTTPGSPLPFPKLNSGTITRIETRYNEEVSDGINALAVATTQQQRDAAQAYVRQFATEANLLRAENDNATILVPNVSAKALGDAVLASMQAHSEAPAVAFLSQFQHFYSATRPGADLIGFNGNDLLIGGTGFNQFIAQGGNDTLDGSAGGTNVMQGGDGSDLYIMGPGTDNITDGILDSDIDLVSYIRSPTGLVVDLEFSDGDQGTGYAKGDRIGGVEGAIGSNFDDLIMGRNLLQGPQSSDQLFGAGGNDTILGGEGSDTITGGSGNDVLDGGSNAATGGSPGPDDMAVFAANPNEVHFFNSANGLLVATPFEGVDTLRNIELLSFAGQVFSLNQITLSNAGLQVGGDAAETLQGNTGVDLIYGGAGNDRLDGGDAGDLLLGQLGNDQLLGGAGDDTLDGGNGSDRVTGGNGRDLARLGAGNDLFADNTQGGPEGRDTVFAGAGDDTIEGGHGNDAFRGETGNDLIFARLGADEIFGGDGADSLFGGEGNDSVTGGNGRDMVYLGNGNDIFFDNDQGGDPGRDTVFAGAGDDTIEGGNGGDVFHGETGSDLIFGRKGADKIFGGGGADSLYGGNGNDSITGGNGRDTVFMGDGADIFFDNTQGGANGADNLFAGAGHDTIEGGNGSDIFRGEAGNDLIFGRKGHDTLVGGAGNDTMDGGPGADTFVFGAGFGVDVINGYEAGGDMLQFDDALWSGTLSAAQVVNQFARVVGGDVVFDFGAEEVTLTGISSLTGLENDLVIV